MDDQLNMKRFIITALLGLGLCSVGVAAPSAVYQNFGVTTNTPTIDANIFYNAGTFFTFTDFDVTSVNPTTTAFESSIPYSTSDTLYYTNTTSGTIEGTPGFLFDTVTPTWRYSAASFDNEGVITAFDVAAVPETYANSVGFLPAVDYSQVLASQALFDCTNIVNAGTISVGNGGLLQMVGSNINLVNGALVAGAVNTGGGNGLEFDSLDTTGNNGLGFYAGAADVGFFVNPPGVYDLFWGVTNGGTLALDQFNPPETTLIKVGARDGITGGTESLPLNFNPEFATFVSSNNSTTPSNSYLNIVFVNTNFIDLDGQTDTNITVSVGFSYDWTLPVAQIADTQAKEVIVQFAMPVFDVITGQIVTNAVYLQDVGAALNTMIDNDNASSADGYSRGNAFLITTTPPDAWLDAETANAIYNSTDIYSNNTYSGKDVPYEAAIYAAQIGRNPGELDGSFSYLDNLTVFSTNFQTNLLLDSFGIPGAVDLPDPTNEPARIELAANEINLSNSRWRAEGMVTINASNFVGSTLGSDWGEISAHLGAASGSLLISNVFPTSFQRLRGDIYAYTLDWQNTITNGITNTVHYHLLVVDQNLGGNFQSAIRDLKLTATNSVNVQDSLYVIDSEYFYTSNLTFNSNVVFTQNAGALTPANMPNLKNFFNNTNANFAVDNQMDIGFDVSKLPAAPAGRTYTVNSITNLGSMFATAPLLQSQFFENDGNITAEDNGSMVIEAGALGLGLVLTNATNTLLADQNIILSAISMGMSNSQIFAGGSDGLGQGMLTLQTTATGQIADFVSGAPTTNTHLVNYWQVTDGFSLPVKPATGDLFGTEIMTIATNFEVALHTWAGVDMGPVPAGFSDNMVIGHLKLSRQSTNAELHFTGAGAQNGMYVDYLDLDTNSQSYTNYREGLVIDPNLTIYFAACNVNPLKLEEVYPNRLVWVTNFAGPNSTVAVPYYDSTNVCLMNMDVAFSPDISFFPPVPNADNQPYVLNNPTNITNFITCPTDVTMLRDLSAATLLQEFNFASSSGTNVNLVISSIGRGSVSPELKQSQIALGNKYSLTATPAAGWAFSGWSASGLSEEVDKSSPELKFTLENDLVLTANFIPKTFTLAKGAYYGLFTNRVPASDNSGWFTATLGQSGVLSGRLLMGPSNYTFSSSLSSNGSAQFAAKAGGHSLNVTLSLDLANPTGQVTGMVTDGTWSSQLLGNLAPGWTKKNPSPYVGQYTLVLANTNEDRVPAGESWGSLSVNNLGVLSVAGKLADGNAFSQSVPISTNGLWPFYAYVARGHDFLLGWIAFQNNGLEGPNLGETNILWSKAAFSGDFYYPGGFTSMFDLTASPYSFPGRDTSGLILTDPEIILRGGDAAGASTNSVAYNGKLMYAGGNLTLNINAAVGSFTGSLQNPGGGPSIKLSGVVLQNQNGGFGFSLGTNDATGVVLLRSQ
jgi:hypothetical protein